MSSNNMKQDSSEATGRTFQNRLRGLLEVTNRLTQAKSFDDLCRMAVELGRKRLDFDRMGLWFFDPADPEYICGSYGTDPEGRTRDERGWRRHMPGVLNLLRETNGVDAVAQNGPLNDAGVRILEKGERAFAPIMDADKIVGLLSADNLVSRRRMVARDMKVLTLYASTLGHLISRQKSEHALRSGADNLRHIIEKNADAMVILDRQGVVRFANPAAALLSGIPVEKLVGDAFGLPLTSEDQVEVDIFRPDGEPRVAEMRMVEVEWEGQPAYLASLHDITKRKRAEQALRTTQRQIEFILGATKTGLNIIDSEFNVRYIDPEWRKVYGETGGRKCYEYFMDRGAPCPGCGVVKAMNTKARIVSEEVLPKEGNRPIQVITIPFQADDGEWLFAEVNIDIAERKQAEQEKAALQAQLLQAQKMDAIGRLAGGVAHDFNNLLTTIQGFAELGLMDCDESNPLHENIKRIHGATLRAANLVRQLLLFSRKQPTDLGPLNVNATINDLLKMMNRLLGEDVTVVTEFSDQPLTIKGDAGNIEQVVMNLAINARDAMPDGGTLTIKTDLATVTERDLARMPAARPGQFVRIRVQDTGVGMDPETIPRIFEPFFSTKEKGKGTGLGLSVVYGIVTSHGGWTHVESQPGHGATFEVFLPADLDAVPQGASAAIPSEMPKGKGERILVVEDEDEVRLVATRTLSEYGYEVVSVASAQEAVRAFQDLRGQVDLLFSDVVLPGEDGIWLIDALRSQKPDLGVLLASGYSDDKSQWPAIRRRGFHFINKPYKVSDLLNAAQEAMRAPRDEA
ncbi:MAG: ATP-binding protein [Planctomycetota bacterium]